MTSEEGTVYLIHFEQPVGDPSNPRGQARHYLGYTNDLETRIQDHRNTRWERYDEPLVIAGRPKLGATFGNGATLIGAANAQGIVWQVVRTWSGGRDLERQLKNQKNNPRLCPICRNEKEQN